MTFPFNEVYQAQNDHRGFLSLPLANGCSTWTDFKSCLQQTSHTQDQLEKRLSDHRNDQFMLVNSIHMNKHPNKAEYP